MSRYPPRRVSLLVRNLPLDARSDEIRGLFERYGEVRDVYLPRDYYSDRPRGFGFIEFRDARDAEDALYHLDRSVFGGREISVVMSKESRKTPREMIMRERVDADDDPHRHPSHRDRRRSRSPQRRRRSRTPRRRSPSPRDRGGRDRGYYRERSRSRGGSPRDIGHGRGPAREPSREPRRSVSHSPSADRNAGSRSPRRQNGSPHGDDDIYDRDGERRSPSPEREYTREEVY